MRVLKILTAAVAGLVLLALIGIAIVAATFDPNDYKGLVTEQFAARTGRTLTIDEDLRLAYFPWFAVETGGVTIGGSAAFGATPLATVRRVAARVKLMPLLSWRIEIGTVELEGFTLNLARDAQLRGNWQDLIDALSTAAPTTEPVTPQSVDDTALAVEGVRIADGNLFWHENTTELRYSITGLTLETGGLGSGEPVSFEAELTFKDETSGLTAALAASAVAAVTAEGAVTATDLDARVTMNAGSASAREFALTAAELAYDSAAQTLRVAELATETAGIRASWELAGAALAENPTLEGRVSIAQADLATVFAELGVTPPQGVALNELGTATLQTEFRFEASPLLVRVANLEGAAFGMEIHGSSELDGRELAGTLEIPEFTPSPAVQAWLRTAVPPTVDVSALERLALKTQFDTNLDTGRAAVRALEAHVFGATIAGNLEALPGERGNIFRGSVATSRFTPETFAKAFAALLPPDLGTTELGSMQLAAGFEFDASTDTVSVPSFEAELFGIKASGTVTGRGVSRQATWTGTAKVAQFSPQDLLQRFGLPPQPTSDARALTRATLDTRFTATAERAELADVVLALDDSKITGDFTLVGFEQPAYRFALAVDRVDADRYLPPKARDAQADEATAGDIELPQNNTMDLDGTLQIGSLALAGMQFQDVGTRVLIGNGDAKLENARARLYGGTFNGNFHVRAAGSEPGLALDGTAAALDLAPLITALTGEPANFSGKGNFDLNLRGSGRTVIENVQTAAGNVNFEMTNGAIEGFNLGHALCSAYNVTQRAPAPADQQAVTAYQTLKGSAVVTAGTAASQDLLARTEFMDMTGAGTLALVAQQLDYVVDAKLTAPIRIPGCQTLDQFVGDALPFNIKGTVTAPSIMPDFSKLVRQQIREEVQERIQERVQDRLRDILRNR